MGLFDDIPTRQRARCTIAIVREKLSEEDRQGLERVLADESIPGAAITRVLTSAGHDVATSTLNRHRRGECQCGRAS